MFKPFTGKLTSRFHTKIQLIGGIFMADENIMLHNYSDDSQIKLFMRNELAPKVFNNIPLNILNTGMFSLTSEYISQITEQLAFTSSFYFNEEFITKAVLPDSIYAEAAIFNIGYAFATPASSNFLLELRISDIYDNAVYNANTGLYEFILDKNTKFNLPEGYTYSLDYDILIQFRDQASSSADNAIPAWNIQYTNKEEPNVCATNKGNYITYRVTETWLCLLIQANEYERTVYTVMNTMTNGVPNEDTVITNTNHIAGIDVTYVDGKGGRHPLPRNHILAVHDTVPDGDPYVHYIMDNPQTIRFMWQFNGTRYFVPEPNSSFEITVYSCHGRSANAPNYKNEKQPSVITSSNKYTNNANVTKAVFVISGCFGGVDIGSVEAVRRETIEAYNTANVLSTDHDIDEWFKTFYFRNILYPYFFKRRDDPWCRTWSGYLALNDDDDFIYKTNTLHAHLTYDELYNNGDNTVSNNEIIIPPGWLWTYSTDQRNERDKYWVVPYTKADGTTIEPANTQASVEADFIFANPFGIRIQKDPFAIGYFNPWVNQYMTATKVNRNVVYSPNDIKDDDSVVYHASHIISNIVRTYVNDHYLLTTHILPNVPKDSAIGQVKDFVHNVRVNAIPFELTNETKKYFNDVQDPYAETIPITVKTGTVERLTFDPNRTYLCVKEKVQGPSYDVNKVMDVDNRVSPDDWSLNNIWIEDETGSEVKTVRVSLTGDKMTAFGSNNVWGINGIAKGQDVSEDTLIRISPSVDQAPNLISFERIESQNYYEMRLKESIPTGRITKIIVGEAYDTDLQKYGESRLVRIGKSYQPNIYVTIEYNTVNERNEPVVERIGYIISNAANIYMPYSYTINPETKNYEFDMNNVGATGIVLYADMKPSPQTGSYAYWRVKFADLLSEQSVFYIHSEQFKMKENEMRVVAHTMINGSETGRVEMQPVRRETDGSYQYECSMYPLNELIDMDNKINIASVVRGGGSWTPTTMDTNVALDAMNPQIKITILIKSKNDQRPSEISAGDDFTGYRIVDEYTLDDLTLIQELKEMRSVVRFDDTTHPTTEQKALYDSMIKLGEYDSSDPLNLFYMIQYAYNRAYDRNTDSGTSASFITFKDAARANRILLYGKDELSPESETIHVPGLFDVYDDLMKDPAHPEEYVRPAWFNAFATLLQTITTYASIADVPDWKALYNELNSYNCLVNDSFESVNVNGGITIQLVPFVARSLMNCAVENGVDRFVDFVTAFTQVHKAIEPVIFKRLDGNHYLDCKLIGTYGKSRTYVSDTDPDRYWPDLSMQMEFDVKLFNKSLSTNTISELRSIVKSYFNRITTVHAPNRDTNMDNNIYVSHLIQQMEAHDNVAWMKFKGWYTDQKGNANDYYRDANTQSVELKWRQLEDMQKYADGTSQLEQFTPEMFVLEDDNIKINIV